MKKIVTILLFALTVFAGCSKDEKPTPAPTMPVNGVIYLHSESVLKNEPAAKAATRGATAAEQTLTYTFEAWTNDTASDPHFKKFISETDYKGFVTNKHEWLPIPLNEVNNNP